MTKVTSSVSTKDAAGRYYKEQEYFFGNCLRGNNSCNDAANTTLLGNTVYLERSLVNLFVCTYSTVRSPGDRQPICMARPMTN
jgi:hypothetical protein